MLMLYYPSGYKWILFFLYLSHDHLFLSSFTGADKRLLVCGSFRSPALHPGVRVHGALGGLQAALRLARLPVLKKALATLALDPGQNLGEICGVEW